MTERGVAVSAPTCHTTVTIAVVDIEVDVRHPEFDGRVVEGFRASPRDEAEDALGWQPHGTEVAGLALASGIRVRGTAPQALLMPVRVPALARGVGDRSEADGIRWAAEHGADVICCAWGPTGQKSTNTPLPAHTRDAIDYALSDGRNGKGCVVVFSSGNDGSDLRLNGYAGHPGVIAVGACTSAGRRPSYSGWGQALWCVAPSNDPNDPVAAAETYTTTTPIGSFLLGETYYTSRFGFTSAACGVVAGVCAQMLQANPLLSSLQVRHRLGASCTKIDVAGETYDARGHSLYYGFGRVDAIRAVELANAKPVTLSVY